MKSKGSKQVVAKNNDNNSRANARGKNRQMSSSTERSKLWVLVDLKRMTLYRKRAIRRLSESPAGMATVSSLYLYTDYSNTTLFKRSVLQWLHDKEFVNYDRDAETVHLTRLGWLVARYGEF
ncbi:MAG: hypothetical protein OXI34_00560 [Chloroflexota bacterium]|nr:hypothetical protein [Chloroflexota bacterium]MDE2948425.1 hypothetical protein [Chloroflexota bacterium]